MFPSNSTETPLRKLHDKDVPVLRIGVVADSYGMKSGIHVRNM